MIRSQGRRVPDRLPRRARSPLSESDIASAALVSEYQCGTCNIGLLRNHSNPESLLISSGSLVAPLSADLAKAAYALRARETFLSRWAT